MAFDNLPPESQAFINGLVANIEAGTHGAHIIRYSGDASDPHPRIVQKAVAGAGDHQIPMESYGSGDAFNRLVAKGFLKGSWISADTWEGDVDPSAVEEYRKG